MDDGSRTRHGLPTPIGGTPRPRPRGPKRVVRLSAVALGLPMLLLGNCDPPSSGGPFVESFDGAPAVPTPFLSPRWDVVVQGRDARTVETGLIHEMDAHHGPHCEAPMATHRIVHAIETVFVCNNHLMTAHNDGGYGALYITPRALIDFRNGTAVLEWDVSTLVESARDWWDVWILPQDMRLPGEDWFPDAAFTLPDRAVHIRLTSWDRGRTGLEVGVYRDGQRIRVNSETFQGLEQVVGAAGLSATRRDTMRLEISQTHLKFGLPHYNFWYADTDIPALGWNTGVVKFGHHSYSPTKDDRYAPAGPGTWHWDNVFINPALPR